ncbi:VOC family protein [Bacillus solimangrovi]|uniref:Acetyltransferase n=1 Tax=Bacillus solimangrovi TaxID=1305675 RepID=A0A1E5LJY1_9BACI|nr:VOC family protein [Bacillus solimangrovi]OEH94409.1 acetyltransferase [Bacillus solimangrovi]
MKSVRRIDSVFVPVTDISSAEEWYMSIFPFKVVYRSIDEQYVGFRFDEEGEIKTALTLYKVDEMPERNHIPFNFYCEDIDGYYTFVTERGVKVNEIQGGDGMRFFDLFDPDGNQLGVVTF